MVFVEEKKCEQQQPPPRRWCAERAASGDGGINCYP